MLSILFIMTFTASAVFAGDTIKDKAMALVEKNLSAKLKTELLSENLSVKFTKIEQNSVSDRELILKGSALAVLPKERTELPIQFEAKVDPVQEIVNDVEYAFVESVENSYAPTNDEEFLMKHLLKKISTDYKTENVVIAIDGFETKNPTGIQKEYKGFAEVRIGDIEWKIIDFDVVLNGQNTATKIEYKLR